MAAVDVGTHSIEDTTRWDAEVDDFRRELDIPETDLPNNTTYYTEPAKDIDEEIKITKKRKPVAKLDAERLLSKQGLPELRKRATKRIKLRGKGNEFEDIGNLLQMYQMWLDDLYPKAKFRDGLAMIEKVGHTKQLNVMRRAWITSTRPGQADDPKDDDGDFEPGNDVDASAELFPHSDESAPLAEVSADPPQDDELDALLAEETAQLTDGPTHRPVAQPFAEEPDEDDLDALLDAEASTEKPPAGQDDFAAEEEIMNEMGW